MIVELKNDETISVPCCLIGGLEVRNVIAGWLLAQFDQSVLRERAKGNGALQGCLHLMDRGW